MFDRVVGSTQGVLSKLARTGFGLQRQAEPPVSLGALLERLPAMPPAATALGVTADGRPVVLDLGQGQVGHVMVAGGEDAGKTTLLLSLALGLALANRQARVQLMAISGNERQAAGASPLEALNRLPHMLAEVTCQVEQAAEWLGFLAEEMDYRLSHAVASPIIVLLVDRLATLLEEGGRPVADPLVRLAQRGLDAGIHLVAATRRPDAAAVDNLLRASMGLRLVGRVEDARAARLACGRAGSHAEQLLGRGEFLAVNGETFVPFQAAAVAGHELDRFLAAAAGPVQSTLLAQPVALRTALAERQSIPDAAPFVLGQNGSG